MTTDLGNKRAGVGTIVLEDDCDWTLRLTPSGASVWPAGTTAWCRFYEEDGTVLLTVNGEVTEEAITFSMQSDGTPKPADLPDACKFKIRVSLPGSPTTEAVVWRGGLEKEK